MTLQITPLSSLVLALSWQGQPGVTYTLQTSPDLAQWSTLPYVVDGDGSMETYYLDGSHTIHFARLRYSADGDSNENGLPDHWEWQAFGHLDVDPDDDPDMDGDSNYTECLAQTDPLDFYNGDPPDIHVISGRIWLVPAGQVSAEAIALKVCRPSGEPIPNAPIRLSTRSGFAGILPIGESVEMPVAEALVWTDSIGRISPGMVSIHLVARLDAGTQEDILIQAGRSAEEVAVLSVGTDFGPPPRCLRVSTNPEGKTVYSWKGDPGSADRFLLDNRSASGNWQRLADLAVAELSPPDPIKGHYQLTLE